MKEDLSLGHLGEDGVVAVAIIALALSWLLDCSVESVVCLLVIMWNDDVKQCALECE